MSLIKTYKELPVFKASKLAADYTNARYGKLTIVRPIKRDAKGIHLYWLAKCECGTQVEVRAHQLKGGVGLIDSCGRCQKLKRYSFAEVPYTLVDDKKTPEQKELPLEDMSETEFNEVMDRVRSEEEGKLIPAGKEEVTAWGIAWQCCELLSKLTDRSECVKAYKLIQVQMRFGSY